MSLRENICKCSHNVNDAVFIMQADINFIRTSINSDRLSNIEYTNNLLLLLKTDCH